MDDGIQAQGGEVMHFDASTDEYAVFLAGKMAKAHAAGIESGYEINSKLFEFQRDIVERALRLGRFAVWADCGLGKAWIAIEWARICNEHTRKPALILTPLAVCYQFIDEGTKLGVDIRHIRSSDEAHCGINVINYESLHKVDPSIFGCVAADESSILKNFTSKTRNQLIDMFQGTPYRLACTATPAPNDHMEIGNHSEFLGYTSRTEMLSTYFVHDGGETQKWRLKKHAVNDFWSWVGSWAVALKRPGDIGYDQDDVRYDLPELVIHNVVVPSGLASDGLFGFEAKTLSDQRRASRSSLENRCNAAIEIATKADGPVLVWCNLNDESAMISRALPYGVEVKGSDSNDHKEAAMLGFSSGSVRHLVTKPSIAGWGMNWQHCNTSIFVGLTHSFESYYQAVRRTWRFGQKKPVHVYIISSDAEVAVVESIERKQAQAEEMVAQIVKNLGGHQSEKSNGIDRRREATFPGWIRSRDSVRDRQVVGDL